MVSVFYLVKDDAFITSDLISNAVCYEMFVRVGGLTSGSTSISFC